MSYLPKKERLRIINNLQYEANNPGELNFLIMEICIEYFKHHGGSYQQSLMS
jgi:hypothetical protein